MEFRTAEAGEEVASEKIKRVEFVGEEVINPYPDSPQPVRRTSPPVPWDEWDEIAPVVVHSPPTQECGADLGSKPSALKNKTSTTTKEKTKTD